MTLAGAAVCLQRGRTSRSKLRSSPKLCLCSALLCSALLCSALLPRRSLELSTSTSLRLQHRDSLRPPEAEEQKNKRITVAPLALLAGFLIAATKSQSKRRRKSNNSENLENRETEDIVDLANDFADSFSLLVSTAARVEDPPPQTPRYELRTRNPDQLPKLPPVRSRTKKKKEEESKKDKEEDDENRMEKFLREWRQDAVNKHQYDSAIFIGDKLLALTS
ncbi:hypothetical protein H072_5944 [Dactylellina haptotyla CBS 200.50]|uniref:Uncharacterized protein n=1 Tax=Dactylellina haptotyla (strain CBS 200.50) TaxID=1284197 RepID=S8ABB8_DACHA|nr:hypothetical protein H072_5944 [Dactylellina haptotyla CBS 200.50]